MALRALTAGDGEPLLLLHGFGLSPLTYLRTVDRLATGHRVIAPWLGGGGPGWAFERVVAEVVATLDAAAADTAAVVGHSFGGAVGLGLAAAAPDRVRALVLVNSLGLSPGRASLARMALRGNTLRYTTYPAARDFLATVARDPRGLARSAMWSYRADLADACAALVAAGVPRAVLWAARDGLLPLAVGRRLAERLEARLQVVDGPGPVDHDWPYRRPVLFAERVAATLAEISRPSAGPGAGCGTPPRSTPVRSRPDPTDRPSRSRPPGSTGRTA